jgi:enoyl-CoA hydratase/carnithine racemase
MNLLKARVSPRTARDAVLGGTRYAADEAIAAGLADAKAAEADVLSEAKKLASSLASKERRIFKTLKRTLHAGVAAGFGVER